MVVASDSSLQRRAERLGARVAMSRATALLCHCTPPSTLPEGPWHLDRMLCTLRLGYKTPRPLVPLLGLAPKKSKTREACTRKVLCATNYLSLPLLPLR